MTCIVVLSEVSSVEEVEKEKPDLIVASLKEKASIVKFISVIILTSEVRTAS